MSINILASALHYAEHGLSVVPLHTSRNGRCSCANPKCESPGKHPRMRWRGQSHTALTPLEISELWRKYPDSNVGIVTGEVSKIVVIDIDGDEGIDALRTIGLDLDSLDAPAVKSGGGGLHIYCKYPEQADYDLATRAGILPSVDIRADGGLIVAPPSIHPSGNRYEWIDGLSLDQLPPVDLDLSWVERAKPSTNGKIPHEEGDESWYEDLLQGVSEGERNDAATRLAGRWLGMGHTKLEVLLILLAWNQSNNPPLTHRDLEMIVDSIDRRESAAMDRRELIDKINLALKAVELRDVIRITGDEPQFILRFREGDMQVKTETLLSPHQFVVALAKATKMVIKEFGPKRHPRQAELGEWIIESSRDEDAGSEATSYGEMHAMVMDYLDSQRVISVDGDEMPKHGCFRIGADTAIWIGLGELVDWVNAKSGAKMSRPQAAQKLKAMGWRRHEFRTDEHGKRPAWAKVQAQDGGVQGVRATRDGQDDVPGG